MSAAEPFKNSGGALKNLCLSAERNALCRYQEDDRRFDRSDRDWLRALIQELEQDEEEEEYHGDPRLRLQSFHLIGLDVSQVIKLNSVFFNVNDLTSLTLESCEGTERALETIITEHKKGSPGWSNLNLRSFQIRHEAVNTRFRPRLLEFLTLIRGLRRLAVLTVEDEPSRLEDFVPMLDRHGSTLTSLVWDERPARRASFLPSPIPPPPSGALIEAIAQKCPHLIELGVPIDWGALVDSRHYGLVSYNRWAVNCYRANLRRLRTFNVRNMPYMDPKQTTLSLEDLHSSLANSVLKSLLCGEKGDRETIDPTAPSALQTLVLGAMTYRDVYAGLGCNKVKDKDLYNFLRPQIYRVGRYSFEGRQRPLAVLTETGTYEKTEAAGGDVSILKPYWLG
ncbi:MAG: hypothetical protein Q9220_004284 [cf. Caloplaca sp. 1 TL-2023]